MGLSERRWTLFQSRPPGELAFRTGYEERPDIERAIRARARSKHGDQPRCWRSAHAHHGCEPHALTAARRPPLSGRTRFPAFAKGRSKIHIAIRSRGKAEH